MYNRRTSALEADTARHASPFEGEESLRFSKATDSAASLAGTVKVKRSCQLENSARLFGDTGRGDEYCDSFYNKPKNEGVNAS